MEIRNSDVRLAHNYRQNLFLLFSFQKFQIFFYRAQDLRYVFNNNEKLKKKLNFQYLKNKK